MGMRKRTFTTNREGEVMNEGTTVTSDQLVTAQDLEAMGIMRKSTAYRMCKAGLLDHYKVGIAGGGIRFKVREVLAALRVPSQGQREAGGGR
jgi:hypothetical protein